MQEVVIRLEGPLSSSQPSNGFAIVPTLNYVRNSTFTKDHKKTKHHTCKHVLIPCHDMSCRVPYSLLIQIEKDIVDAAFRL